MSHRNRIACCCIIQIHKQPYWTKVLGGVVTPKYKASEAMPPCQHDFKKEFVRLPSKN